MEKRYIFKVKYTDKDGTVGDAYVNNLGLTKDINKAEHYSELQKRFIADEFAQSIQSGEMEIIEMKEF